MATTTIKLDALQDELGGPGPATAYVTARATSARVDGPRLILPIDVEVQISPDHAPDLVLETPDGETWAWTIEVLPEGWPRREALTGTYRFAGAEVTWADLEPVDPRTLEPMSPMPPSVQEVLDLATSKAQAAEIAAANAASAQASAAGYASSAAGSAAKVEEMVPLLARPGNRTVFLGDSITAGSDIAAQDYRGMSWPTIASMISGQRIEYVRNAGIGGDRTIGMINRFSTDVALYNPQLVNIGAGTNDLLYTAFEVWTEQMETLVDMVRAIGAVPTISELPPFNTLALHQIVIRYNGWIRQFASKNKITVIPFYDLLVDPATGNYKTQYYNDGTHPNGAGLAAMGKLAADVLSPLLPDNRPVLCSDDVEPVNSIYRGCFASATGTTPTTGWIDSAGVPASSSLSYVSDPLVPGKLATLTMSGAPSFRQQSFYQYCGATTLSTSVQAGATSLILPIRADYGGVLFIGSGATFEIARIASSSGPGPQTETLTAPLKFAHAAGEPVIANGAPGDEMIFSGLITTTGDVDAKVGVAFIGPGTQSPGSTSTRTVFTRGMFHHRFTIPANVQQMNPYFQAGAGTGSVGVGRLGLYNATRLGI